MSLIDACVEDEAPEMRFDDLSEIHSHISSRRAIRM